jgi:protein-S-isoprenylcysteine O-methyltransferase Ste14
MGKAIAGLLWLMLVLGLALFAPAGTVHYVEAWIYLGIFGGASLAVTLYLAKKDPALLERRTKAGPLAEKERSQKIIQALASVAFLSLIVVPALDRRFGWSHVPLAAVVAGDVLVAAAFLGIFFVFRENTFTSATVEVAEEQRIVTTGPYAIVRHPMYASALLLVIGTPPALGSLVGLVTFVPFVAVLVWRLLDEERLLAKDLAGYAEYREKVRFRLIPGVW